MPTPQPDEITITEWLSRLRDAPMDVVEKIIKRNNDSWELWWLSLPEEERQRRLGRV